MKRFYLACKIFATTFLILGGLLTAITHPSYIDLINGVAAGACIFCIWFMGRGDRGNI